MTRAQVAWLAFFAAVVGAGVDRVVAGYSSRASTASVGFEVRDVKWDRTEGGSYVTHNGSARIVGTGAAATGRYWVLVELIRSQRVNPADKPDTLWGTVITSQGSGVITGQDQAYGCNWSKTIKPPQCAREFQELVARWQVVGWVKLDEPVPDSGRSH